MTHSLSYRTGSVETSPDVRQAWLSRPRAAGSTPQSGPQSWHPDRSHASLGREPFRGPRAVVCLDDKDSPQRAGAPRGPANTATLVCRRPRARWGAREDPRASRSLSAACVPQRRRGPRPWAPAALRFGQIGSLQHGQRAGPRRCRQRRAFRVFREFVEVQVPIDVRRQRIETLRVFQILLAGR
jgi:hypothetical protein